MKSSYYPFVHQTDDYSVAVPNKIPFTQLFIDKTYETIHDEKVSSVLNESYYMEIQTLKSFLKFCFDKLERIYKISINEFPKSLMNNSNYQKFLLQREFYRDLFNPKEIRFEDFERYRKIIMIFGDFINSSKNYWNYIMDTFIIKMGSRSIKFFVTEMKMTDQLRGMFKDYFKVHNIFSKRKEISVLKRYKIFSETSHHIIYDSLVDQYVLKINKNEILGNSFLFLKEFSVIVYVLRSFIYIVKLNENHKKKRIENPENSEINLFYSIGNNYFITFSKVSITIYLLPDFDQLYSFDSLAMPKLANTGLIENSKILFYDYNKRVYQINIKTGIIETYMIRTDFILKAFLINENKTLIIGLKCNSSDAIEIWDFTQKLMKYIIEIQSNSTYILGKARISHDENLLLFKSHIFDLNTLTFSDYNSKNFTSDSKHSKKITDLNADKFLNQYFKNKSSLSYNITGFYPEIQKVAVFAIQNFEQFLIIFNNDTEQVLKIQIGMDVYSLRFNLNCIWMQTNAFLIIWNLDSKRQEGFVSLSNFFKKSFSKRSFSVISEKFLIFTDSNYWKIFKFRIFATKKFCECEGIPVKNTQNDFIYIISNSRLLVISLDRKIQEIQIHVSFKIIHAELIDKNLLCLKGSSEILLYNTKKCTEVEFLCAEKSFDVKSLIIVKYGSILIFYQKDVIFYLRRQFFKFNKISRQTFKDLTFFITPDEKFVIFISRQSTLILNTESNEKKHFFYHSKSVEIHEIRLVYSNYLILLISAPKLFLNKQSPEKHIMTYRSEGYSLYVIDLLRFNIQQKNLKSFSEIEIIDLQRILIKKKDKLKICSLSDLKERFSLNVDSFSFVSGSPLVRSQLIIPSKQEKTKQNHFVWGFPLFTLRFAHFSVKRIYLSCKNFDFMIINLKHSTIEACFQNNFLKSIQKLYEFPEENFLILRSSKKMVKFDLKTYKKTLIHSNKSTINCFSVFKSRFFCFLYQKPDDSIKVFLYDVVSEKKYIQEASSKQMHLYLIKLENFIVFYKKRPHYAYNEFKKNWFKIIDINTCQREEDWHSLSYRQSSSAYEGTKKVKKVEKILILNSHDKKYLFFSYDGKWVLMDLDSFSCRIEGSFFSLIQVEFSKNARFLAIGFEDGVVRCYDLSNLKSYCFHPHLTRVTFLNVSDDGTLLSHADKEKEMIITQII